MNFYPNGYVSPYFPQQVPVQQPNTNFQTQMQQAPIQQPIQQPIQPFKPQVGLQGKVVDSVDVVKATDITLDGSVSYFPLTDNSAIVTKQLMPDGTSKVTVYKPVEEKPESLPAKYLTENDLQEALKKVDNKDIKEEIKTLRKQIKDLTNDIEELKEERD